MAQQESDPFWKFITGVLFGIGMTWGYVRFGYELPGIIQMPAKVASAAISITADMELENWDLPIEARQRAAAVIFRENPGEFIELDNGMDHAILTEMCRLKAVRRAKLTKATFEAYDKLLDHPALLETYQRKYNTTDWALIKQRLLQRDITEDEFLRGYLADHWPGETIGRWSERVLDVYQNELRPPAAMIAADPDRPVIR